MILEVQHETRLEYTQQVSEWLTELRMQPVSDELQTCHSFHIVVSQPANLCYYLDGFGNRVHHFNLLAPHQEVRVLAASIVETSTCPKDVANSPATVPFSVEDAGCAVLDFLSFRGPVRETPLLEPILTELKPGEGERVSAWIDRVNQFVQARFEYARYVTDSSSPIEDVLMKGKGVCQDFAHLVIAIMRSFGVPARYVSGYIHRPNKESQSHAWCEIWIPGLDWVGFDPTNGCLVTDDFVRVAIGRDFTDVPPNKGTYRGQGQETISVRVATRELTRLPSLSWHERLPPLDVPLTSVARQRMRAEADEQQQQQ